MKTSARINANRRAPPLMTMPEITPAPIVAGEEFGCKVWEVAGVVVLDVPLLV